MVRFDKDTLADKTFIVGPRIIHENTQWSIWLDSKGLRMETQKQAKIHYSKPAFGDFWDFKRRKSDPRSRNQKTLYAQHFTYSSI